MQKTAWKKVGCRQSSVYESTTTNAPRELPAADPARGSARQCGMLQWAAENPAHGRREWVLYVPIGCSGRSIVNRCSGFFRNASIVSVHMESRQRIPLRSMVTWCDNGECASPETRLRLASWGSGHVQ